MMSTTPRVPRLRLREWAERAAKSLSIPKKRWAETTSRALRLPEGAGGGFEEGRRRPLVDTFDGSPRRVRDSLASYLLSPLSQSPSSQSSTPPPHSIPNSRPILPLTPPSSLSPDRHITSASVPIRSIPLTPTSSRGSDPKPSSLLGSLPRSTPLNCTIMPLITDLFPYHAPTISEAAQTVEIVTPPHQILHGFTHDGAAGRTVYIHLQPHVAPAPPPEHLSANFSDVLRPHDPHRPLGQSAPLPSPGQALDIRESLTALLDLAADSLEATSLILILDRDDRDPDRLSELLHALMYVGGQVVRPGALSGGWQWDSKRWVLVGMEV